MEAGNSKDHQEEKIPLKASGALAEPLYRLKRKDSMILLPQSSLARAVATLLKLQKAKARTETVKSHPL